MLRRTTAIAVAVLLALAACGGDDEPVRRRRPRPPPRRRREPLTILVTNDDGIGAPGIDVLVNALLEIEDVEVHIVAPAENQSGSSDKTTAGGAPYADGATASGVEGTAVEGFPADTIAVALDELGLEPDLVVSGVNEGQNIGPLAYASGTVGAGRAAVRRGIPAIAGSAGFAAGADYELAAELIDRPHRGAPRRVRRRHRRRGRGRQHQRARLHAPAPRRTLVEVPLATVIPEGVNPFESDCSVADPAELDRRRRSPSRPGIPP